MTAVGATTAQLLQEALQMLVFSLGVCFAYQLFTWMFRSRRLSVQTALHCLFFAAAGFVSFCYLIGETVSRAPRWYMAAAAYIGAVIYRKTARPLVAWVLRWAEKGMGLLVWPLRMLLCAVKRRVAVWMQNLQTRRLARYNARRAKLEAQRRKRKEKNAHNAGEKTTKRAIQASAQT